MHLGTSRWVSPKTRNYGQSSHGKAEYVADFAFVAEDARRVMAQLGIPNIDEMVGPSISSAAGKRSITG